MTTEDILKLFTKDRKITWHHKVIKSGIDAEVGYEYTQECIVITPFRTLTRVWHNPPKFKAAILKSGQGYIEIEDSEFSFKKIKKFEEISDGFIITYKKDRDTCLAVWQETFSFKS